MAPDIPFIDRLQAYLRHSADQQYEAVAVPPFTLFFRPSDPLRFFNYAIPDAPITADVQAALTTLKNIFTARNRQPRFEFIQEYTPALAPALVSAGFVEEGRYPMMVCTPETFQVAPVVPDFTIVQLTPASALDEVRTFLTTQRLGFEPTNTELVIDQAVQEAHKRMGRNRCFLGYYAGQPATVGVFTVPHAGVTEITSIATIEKFRRRGLASALTAHVTGAAFAQGVEIACLSAADEDAGRMYQQVGFRTVATMLAYSVPTC
ncbi:MAG: GNAT family N-acetyltransferase [Caldilineaceae bacterium]